ncbi:MAG: hypothetical protein KBA66_07125 [Leptospiraceae bacterium]|nr:hypothetical protein [Leptospiraceae bacterium]
MKLQFLIVVVFLLFYSNCSSLQDYAKNRAYDVRDIFNIGVEENVYGVSAGIDVLQFGLKFDRNAKTYGLRYGHLGEYLLAENYYPFNSTAIIREKLNVYLCTFNKDSKKWVASDNLNGTSLIFFTATLSMSYHKPLEPIKIRNANKNTYFIFKFIGCKICPPTGICAKNGDRYSFFYRDSYVYLPMEASFGLHYGIRLGFNPHELLDFLVGIFGFDLLDDDATTVYTELPIPVEQNQNWEKDLEEVDMEMVIKR